MSALERRLQILIDTDRYDRIVAEADRSGRSVAAIIRDAIDFAFPPQGDDARASAARLLLEMSHDCSSEDPAEPSDFKNDYAAALDAKIT